MIAGLARLLAILLALAACGGAALFVYVTLGNGLSTVRLFSSRLEAPVSSEQRREIFTIRPGQSASAVGEELQQRGLIRSSLAFRWEIESQGVGHKLGAGDYELSPSMSTREIVAVLARGAVAAGTSLTVLEGWRAEQVAARVEEIGLGRGDDLLRLVRSPREQGIALPDPSVASLEGYLFPDTYAFDPKATPVQIVEKMLQQFERRFNESLRRQARERGMTVNQVVTLASIIERESAQPGERPLISSVYHNRLAANITLDADPTVQYAVANQDLRRARDYGFWKSELTLDELKVDSAYNTYRVTGLPPTPICNPGQASLQAAVAPAPSRYLYFVARGDGSHAFAETPEEHVANVQKYQAPR